MKLSNPLTRKWKWNFTALSFAFPCVGMLVVMLISGYIPFGKTSMLYSDMYHQYYPFFVAFRNALQEGTMLFMNIDPNLTVESAVGFPAGLRFAVKYHYYPLGRYLHEQPGKALLRALTVLKEETEAVSRQGTEQLLEANAEIQQLRKQLAEQQQHLADLQNSRAAYEASLENVLGSSSWKLTAPLRKLLGLFHRH